MHLDIQNLTPTHSTWRPEGRKLCALQAGSGEDVLSHPEARPAHMALLKLPGSGDSHHKGTELTASFAGACWMFGDVLPGLMPRPTPC